MSVKPTRLVIYAKDVQKITGRGERSSYALLAQIRKYFGKERYSYISVEEFCLFTGLREEDVGRFLE